MAWQQRFGTPSTTAVFDQTAWYYVSSVQEQVAFYTPDTTERRVMVVRFDGDVREPAWSPYRQR